MTIWKGARQAIYEQYIKEPFKHRKPYYREEEYELLFYNKMVAIDILNEMSKRPDVPPLTIVIEYRDKMETYWTKAGEKGGWHGINMFSIMYDTANDIIDLLICG